MHLQIWMAFVAASLVVLVIPGPTILLILSQTIGHGRRAVFPLLFGVLAGDITCMTLSLLGLSAVLSTSAFLFSILKGVGAVYLIILGIRLWRIRTEESTDTVDTPATTPVELFRSAYVVTASNPKGIMFFVAFVPQFINPHAPALPQFLLLCSTFLGLAAINATSYAMLAGWLRGTIESPRARRYFNRCGGSILITAGIASLALKRTP